MGISYGSWIIRYQSYNYVYLQLLYKLIASGPPHLARVSAHVYVHWLLFLTKCSREVKQKQCLPCQNIMKFWSMLIFLYAFIICHPLSFKVNFHWLFIISFISLFSIILATDQTWIPKYGVPSSEHDRKQEPVVVAAWPDSFGTIW